MSCQPFTITASSSIAIEAKSDEPKKLPTFQGRAYTGVPMRPHDWINPVIIDLKGVRVPKQEIPILQSHDHHAAPLGHTTNITVSDGIDIAGVLSGQANEVAKVTEPSKNAYPWELSVGCEPIRTEFLQEGKKAKVNGIDISGPMTISRETLLSEVSFVVLGADPNTSVQIKAQRGEMSNSIEAKQYYTADEIEKMSAEEAKDNLKRLVMSEDKDKEEMEDEESGSESEKDEEEKHEYSLRKLRIAAANETKRQAKVSEICRKHNVINAEVDGQSVNLAAYAIEHNKSPEWTELQALRAERPNSVVPGGLFHNPSKPQVTDAVLEAAYFQAARNDFRLMDDDFYWEGKGENRHRRLPERDQRKLQGEFNSRYTDQVQQTAHTLFKDRITLQELMVTAARQNGYRGPDRIRDDSALNEIFHFGMRPSIQAGGDSTASLSNVLANVLNKFLASGYLEVESAWREVSAILSLPDFKPSKRINLLTDPTYQPVGPDGEIQNMALSDQAFANVADQKAIIVDISRKNIINDDTSILSTVPRLVGKGAALALNKTFWTTFLSPGDASGNADDGNPFFNNSSGTHGTPPAFQKAAGANYSSGGSTALSSTSLQTAYSLYTKQVDPNGNPLIHDSELPILLVPPELYVTGWELTDPSSFNLVYGGASAAKQPMINIWRGRFKLVQSRYLSNSNFTGYSTTAWYVLYSPNAIPMMETVFLNGVDMPMVQTADPSAWNFNRLSLSIRGVFDYGVSSQNFRGAVKMAGA